AARSVVTVIGVMPERADEPLRDPGEPLTYRAGVLGSGVLVDGGLALTLAHVVEGAYKLRARLASGEEVNAEIRYVDAPSGVTVLALSGSADEVAALALSEKRPRRGEQVVAVGNPFGTDPTITA